MKTTLRTEWWTLTTDHPSSSYGVPVLEWRRDVYGPDDNLPSGMLASDYVASCYRVGDEVPGLVRRYLEASGLPTMHVLNVLAGRHLTKLALCPDCNGVGSVPELYTEGGGSGYAPCPTCRKGIPAMTAGGSESWE